MIGVTDMADLKSLGKFEQGALVAGALTFILSLFPYYIRASFDGGTAVPGLDFSSGTSAWTSYATLGMLLVLIATGLVAVRAFAKDALPAGVPWNLVVLATAGLGALLLILRALTVGGGGGVSVGPGWSGWLIFITSIALTAFAALSFKGSGEEVPWKSEGEKPAI